MQLTEQPKYKSSQPYCPARCPSLYVPIRLGRCTLVAGLQRRRGKRFMTRDLGGHTYMTSSNFFGFLDTFLQSTLHCKIHANALTSRLLDCYSQIYRSYVFGPSGFWTMAPPRYTAKVDPFLSPDCPPTSSTLAQSKERKGSNFAIWQL